MCAVCTLYYDLYGLPIHNNIYNIYLRMDKRVEKQIIGTCSNPLPRFGATPFPPERRTINQSFKARKQRGKAAALPCLQVNESVIAK